MDNLNINIEVEKFDVKKNENRYQNYIKKYLEKMREKEIKNGEGENKK